MVRRVPFAILLSLSLLLPLAIVGQQPAQSPPPPPPQSNPQADSQDVVRITTNLVQIDVVVTKDGKPVIDLQPDDFEILQDGKPQTITNFSYVSNVPAAATKTVNAPANDKLAPVVPPARINPADQRRTVAFVVDDLGMSWESMVHVKKQLRKFMAELSPSDLVAVIRTSGEVGSLQQFTNDQRIISDAIENLRWNPCSRAGLYVFEPRGLLGGGMNASICSAYVLDNTLNSLKFIVRGMGYLPGRKSMIVLSDYLPVEDEDSPFLQRAAKGSIGDLGKDSSGSSADDMSIESNQSYYRQLQLVAELAIRSSVVVYGVDTRGLQYTGLTAQDRLTSGARGATAEINQIMSSRSAQLIRGREGTDLIARQTGGFLIRNSNDFGFKQVMEDQQGYYLIGFRPAEDSFNREFHRIKAKLKRGSGMSVRTRAGFYGFTNDEARPKQLSVDDQMNKALISPFSSTQVNLRLTSFFVNDATAGALIRSFLYLDPRELTFRLQSDGRQVSYLDIRAMIFGVNGRIMGEQNLSGSLRLNEADYQLAMREGLIYSFDVPLKSRGAFQFRVAVRDSVTSRIGAAGQVVEIPNLKDGRLALSGIVARLDNSQTPDAASGSVIAGPAVRRFSPGAKVALTYAIYNGVVAGRSSQLTSQVRVFRDGKVVFTGDAQPVVFQTPTDAGGFLMKARYSIPDDMPPGYYIFQVVVTDSQEKQKPRVAAQWIDFEVAK